MWTSWKQMEYADGIRRGGNEAADLGSPGKLQVWFVTLWALLCDTVPCTVCGLCIAPSNVSLDHMGTGSRWQLGG